MDPRHARSERSIRRDPGGRGVVSFRDDAGRGLLEGELGRAAVALAEHRGPVALVTGFAILAVDPPAAETDGPLGTLVLAAVLRNLGRRVTIVSDTLAEPVLRAGIAAESFAGGPPDLRILPLPRDVGDEAAQTSVRALCDELGPSAAWIAIERVGPTRAGGCRNMRGIDISPWTAPLHLPFESSDVSLTIGIGDGGNEIGLGRVSPDVLALAVTRGNGRDIACRTPATHTILAGVSNWGAYALALACAAEAGNPAAADLPTLPRHVSRLLETLVRDGGAVDGVTGRREATVDGLPCGTEAEVLRDLREIYGLPAAGAE